METIKVLLQRFQETTRRGFDFILSDKEEFDNHLKMIIAIANKMLEKEFKTFQVDEHNRDVLRFLLFYFNGCREAEDVFPNEEYKLGKNLLLVGEPGTGKTLLMRIFAEYLMMTGNHRSFQSISATQLLNYYKMNGHIDKYTYNEGNGGKMFGVCLNDIGIDTETAKSYGTSLTQVMDEFLFARYEIYQQFNLNYHITSNLGVSDLKNRFDGRLTDRFKSFNVLELHGGSRRR